MLKYLNTILLLIVIFTLSTPLVQASHRSDSGEEGRYDSVDRSSLSKKAVSTFPIPVLFGVAYDLITPDFGDSRGDGTRFHEGQDMRAPQGTPIVSPTKAVVMRVGDGESSGKYVYTANPGGESFRYMHLETIADIKQGDILAVGDFIGTVGDTGNAPDGIYHLHFEVKNADNEPTDPYERLNGNPFTTKKKMLFLQDILRAVDDSDEYAEFLVTTFASEITDAKIADHSVPRKIDEALEDTGIDERIKLLEKLDELIMLIPTVIPVGVSEGDTGVAVSLLQTYLIFSSEGPARNALAGASATGYFGPVTKATLTEFQKDNNLSETGQFDSATKKNSL